MNFCIISLFLVILPSSVILTEQQHISLQQSLSEECGVLRADQVYNLARNVEDDEFPWIASVRDTKKRGHLCISVLISKQYLLTATQCFKNNYNPDSYFIELGNCRNQIKCVIRHDLEIIQRFQGGLSRDISVLRLKVPVTITNYIRPICLPPADVSSMQYAAKYLTMTGWQYPGLRSAKFPVIIVDIARCRESYEGLVLDDSFLCASTCDNGWNYDVGSILMDVSAKNSQADRYYLVGILTYGRSDCTDATPDIFQRIDRYMNWIVETIANIEEDVQKAQAAEQ